MSLTQSLMTEVKNRQSQAEDAYREVVERAAGNEPLEPGEVLETLRLAGKTAADLDRDIARQRRIVELETAVAGLPEVQRQRAELAAARAEVAEEETAERLAMEDRHHKTYSEYGGAMFQLDNEVRQMLAHSSELQTLKHPPKPAPPPVNSSFGYDYGTIPLAPVVPRKQEPTLSGQTGSAFNGTPDTLPSFSPEK